MKLFASKVFIYAILLFFVSKIEYNYLKPIFEAESLIFPYAIHPFDICKQFPNTWNLIKNIYIVSFWSSFTIIYFNVAKSICETKGKLSTKFEQNVDKTNINKHFPKPNNLLKITPLKSISSKNAQKSSNLVLNIGRDEQGNIITIPEKGLYQNILITGTIGCGKTSSAMYPFSKQLIEYEANNNQEKLGILALDVKGNFANQIKKYACKVGREKDLIVINLDGIVKYNPLDKPDLKPAVLANRLRKILELFSKNSTESYWLDKSEQIISQAIKLCRLYNDGYVTFLEIHKIVFFKDYYEEKLKHIKELFKKSSFKEDEVYDLISCIDFFEKEFYSLDSRTSAILKSEISLITNLFISDYNVSNTFCPNKDEINFKGFEDMLNTGKIVLLQMNVSEYKNLSKLIATYLKLDYQTAVMKQLSNSNSIRRSVFISDEYQEYIQESDSEFFAECREAKSINILATQSYTSLLNTLKDNNSTKVILQNLINKLWYRTDDIFTIEEVQKQMGKEEAEKHSVTVSENAKKTDYNKLMKTLISRDSNISESYNTYMQKDYIYDTNYFSRNLKTFECLAFLSDGEKILEPQKLQMLPHFKMEI